MAMVGPALPVERVHIKQRELDMLYEKRLAHRAMTGPHDGIDHTDLRLTMRIAMIQQQIERELTMGRDYNDLPYEELRTLAMRSGHAIFTTRQR